MAMSVAVRECVVDDEVAVGHSGDGAHLVGDKDDGGGVGQALHEFVEVGLEAFVDV